MRTCWTRHSFCSGCWVEFRREGELSRARVSKSKKDEAIERKRIVEKIMPRLGGGSQQSYLYSIGGDHQLRSSGSNDSMKLAAHNATTPTYRTNRTASESFVAAAPSSGNRLPHLSTYLDSQQNGFIESERGPNLGGAGNVPTTPSSVRSLRDAPSSLKTTRSLFGGSSSTTATQRRNSSHISPVRRSYASDRELPTIHSDSTPQKPARRVVKAAENGKGAVLPDFNRQLSNGGGIKKVSMDRAPPDRHETRSSPSLKRLMNLPGRNKRSESHQQLPQTHQDTTPTSSMLQTAKNSMMRRRTKSYVSGDEDDTMSRGGGTGYGGHRSSDNESTSHSHSRRERRRGSRRDRQPSFVGGLGGKVSSMKLGNILQVVIVLAVTALVWESHHKALFAAQQLTQFKEEESLLLLHLQKIEQQSIQLHENLGRLAESGVRTGDNQGGQKGNRGGNGEGGGGGVDFDLIHKQTQQLYQMEEELNNEVKTLQLRIQQSARKHVIQEFGEGPVQVLLDLDFGNHEKGGTIAILLWHDTPHAAWTWLEQIGRHVWDGSEFSWEQGHAINAAPGREDPMQGGKIEFVEQSQHGHEAWTVGLRENDSGKLQMYINLADNTNLHKHETCVGKVIDGFDALQKLLEVSRNKKNDSSSSTIQIKKATAQHVAKKEGAAQGG